MALRTGIAARSHAAARRSRRQLSSALCLLAVLAATATALTALPAAYAGDSDVTDAERSSERHGRNLEDSSKRECAFGEGDSGERGEEIESGEGRRRSRRELQARYAIQQALLDLWSEQYHLSPSPSSPPPLLHLPTSFALLSSSPPHPLNPSAASSFFSAFPIPPSLPPPSPPHLEDCIARTSARLRLEMQDSAGTGEFGGAEGAGGVGGQGSGGQGGGEGGSGGGGGGVRRRRMRRRGGWREVVMSGKSIGAMLKHTPRPPWIRGPDSSLLPFTRIAQRDIWLHQFPPSACSLPPAPPSSASPPPRAPRFLLLPWPRIGAQREGAGPTGPEGTGTGAGGAGAAGGRVEEEVASRVVATAAALAVGLATGRIVVPVDQSSAVLGKGEGDVTSDAERCEGDFLPLPLLPTHILCLPIFSPPSRCLRQSQPSIRPCRLGAAAAVRRPSGVVTT
ncbi:hypothetical protein CLOP_g9917 [Closterium sp. NIES-67]|nr:hypothetical protein CLOP_g9917 [Closterium sp. NIES-67]